MKTVACLLGWVSAVISCGCYDFSLKDDNHTVTDLRLLAIRAEPPYLKPASPLVAEALVADPKGGGRVISCAWKVDYFDPNLKTSDHPTLVFPSKSGDTEMGLPALNLRTRDKYATPALILEAFLCSATMNIPDNIAGMSDGALLKTLCPKGSADLAEKSVYPLSNDFFLLFGWDIPLTDTPVTQTNPRVSRLFVNGIEVTAMEDNGEEILLCGSRFPCDALLFLSVTLDSSSIDRVPITAQDKETDAPEETDTSTEDAEPETDTETTSKRFVAEPHRIDWWVTGGSLSAPSSFGSTIESENGTADSMSGPYENLWEIPEDRGSAKYTLYVVARDLRGGNGWKTYRFRTEGK